jgi:hypothetical protein
MASLEKIWDGTPTMALGKAWDGTPTMAKKPKFIPGNSGTGCCVG